MRKILAGSFVGALVLVLLALSKGDPAHQEEKPQAYDRFFFDTRDREQGYSPGFLARMIFKLTDSWDEFILEGLRDQMSPRPSFARSHYMSVYDRTATAAGAV